ncbi:MAG TPA: hypothetical protein DCO77_11565 [Nitrospiraceae bacterium]|nr:hypothetical protein [Nitrospiraceae bacterium]
MNIVLATAVMLAAHSTGAGTGGGGHIAHQSIQSYDGPATCISCHQVEAEEMLGSLHMQWSGPTPDLTNTNGENLGKGAKGINTFCTYAMSSKGACFSCHVRADGNAPHPPEVTDVDCLMCHNDTYQRTVVTDPNNTETVTNVLGETKTYVFGKVDAQGNYTSVPDFNKMPAGTTMVELARTVHMPTRQSCLRCHAKAGGGDWTKRGDMGLSTANPTVDEDVHMSPNGADLTCAACHSTQSSHTVGGRGIDLRATEAPAPTCQACHTSSPHSDSTLNRHANGQVSCQVCHIRSFGKGGATEMSRDWLVPTWNSGFCSGQGGFVGEEIKESFVKPEYVWFDGTSSVYNVGETITADSQGVYNMAAANGNPFDGKSSIVPIKRHFSVMPLHESGEIVPPEIMWMFMTGDFDQAVQRGMADFGMTGTYTMVDAEAEMLIAHGVAPKSKAKQCATCHDSSGETPAKYGPVDFGALGYHTWPAKVKDCTLCHSAKSMSWRDMHNKHAEEMGKGCVGCHTTEPTGWVEPPTKDGLCNNCHSGKTYDDPQKLHEKHAEADHGTMETTCTDCHTFDGGGGSTPPPPAPLSCSDYTQEAPCDDDPNCYWSNRAGECRDR